MEEKKINFVETKKISLTGYTLIEGFPDIGLAGTIGSKYLIENLDFKQIGYIDTNLLMPMIRVQKGLPMHPIRIYASEIHKTVIIIAEQIIPNSIANLMAQELIKWIKKKKIKEVIATSGISLPGGSSVYAFASDERSKKVIRKHKFEMVENGITSGVTALIMLYLRDNNIDAFCLMGNTKNKADYNAAAEIVKAFASLIGISIDVKPLLKEAKKLEGLITEHLKKVQESNKTVPTKKGISMYT